jgi:hypothetical protein
MTVWDCDKSIPVCARGKKNETHEVSLRFVNNNSDASVNIVLMRLPPLHQKFEHILANLQIYTTPRA